MTDEGEGPFISSLGFNSEMRLSSSEGIPSKKTQKLCNNIHLYVVQNQPARNLHLDELLNHEDLNWSVGFCLILIIYILFVHADTGEPLNVLKVRFEFL